MFALADARAVGRASFLVFGAKCSASVKRLKHQTFRHRRDSSNTASQGGLTTSPSHLFNSCDPNTMNGGPAPPGLWQEARNADGRVYYYNVQTKATQWQKPLELMTPAEVMSSPES